MSQFLKRSWDKNEATTKTTPDKSLSDEFEAQVLAHARGSIATVLRDNKAFARNPETVPATRSKHAPPPLEPPKVEG